MLMLYISSGQAECILKIQLVDGELFIPTVVGSAAILLVKLPGTERRDASPFK